MPSSTLEKKYRIHKDSSPEETVKKARAILSELGLFLLETKWSCGVEGVYSARVEDAVLKVGTNGKGVSKKYVLAGAHAEFLERLQSGGLIKQEMGVMESPVFFAPDRTWTGLGRLARQHKPLMKILLSESVDKVLDTFGRDTKIPCYSYYSVAEKSVVSLPVFVNWATGTNGLCAGNTPEEALCQGICEVFERYVGGRIFDDEAAFPTLPLSSFEGTGCYGILKSIVDQGNSVIIKDATLGGVFPVLAVIIVNEKRDRYVYAFGSDPVADVALQRCITEVFQGPESDLGKVFENRGLVLDFSSRQFKDKYFPSAEEQKSQEFWFLFRDHSGELPHRFFLSGGRPKFRDAFQREFKDHRDSLKFLLGIVEANGYKLYVRDQSFLNFSSYKVYIPGLSEIQKTRNEEMAVRITERQFIKKCLLDLRGCPADALHKCARLLEPLLDIPGHSYELTRRDFLIKEAGLMVDASSDVCQFGHLAYLLTFMFCRAGDYKKAHKYLNLYLREEGETLENRGYYTGVLLYLRLKAQGVSARVIQENLDVFCGEGTSREIIDDLGSPDDIFKYFTLPKCGDCSRCPIAEQCFFEDWKKVVLKLNEKMAQNPISQERLAAVFAL